MCKTNIIAKKPMQLVICTASPPFHFFTIMTLITACTILICIKVHCQEVHCTLQYFAKKHEYASCHLPKRGYQQFMCREKWQNFLRVDFMYKYSVQ